MSAFSRSIIVKHLLKHLNKLKLLNPFIVNWTINFLSGRQQRVIVDGVTTKFLSISQGVPHRTVLGPVLFSLMINDLKAVDPERNLLIKLADDINLGVPVRRDQDPSIEEGDSIRNW